MRVGAQQARPGEAYEARAVPYWGLGQAQSITDSGLWRGRLLGMETPAEIMGLLHEILYTDGLSVPLEQAAFLSKIAEDPDCISSWIDREKPTDEAIYRFCGNDLAVKFVEARSLWSLTEARRKSLPDVDVKSLDLASLELLQRIQSIAKDLMRANLCAMAILHAMERQERMDDHLLESLLDPWIHGMKKYLEIAQQDPGSLS